MPVKDNLYKGLSFPFRFDARGKVATSTLTHDDVSRIEESVRQIIGTYLNERIMNTDMGVTRGMIFDPLDDLTDQSILRHGVTEAIEKFEDRVTVNSVDIYTDDTDEGKLIIDISVHIIKFIKDVDIKVGINKSQIGGGLGG